MKDFIVDLRELKIEVMISTYFVPSNNFLATKILSHK